MMTAALGQEALNFARVAPSVYALRPPPASAAHSPPSAPGGVEGHTAAALAALSLPALRAIFQATVGRPSTSKNKGWLVARLAERGVGAPAEAQ